MRLLIVSQRPQRRRAGFAFTREPVELTREDLGEGLAALVRFSLLLGDPCLMVTMVSPDGTEQLIGDEERQQITALLEAEQARPDPSAPPTTDAAASLDGNLTPDGAPQAAGTDAGGPDGAEASAPSGAETDTAPEDSQPAGEETASPAAEAAGARTRRKAREG